MMCKVLLPLFLLGLLYLSTVQVARCDQSEPWAPYITIGDRVLPNNSYLSITEIGRNASTGVQCHTDLANESDHGGHWLTPYSYQVLTSPSYYRPIYAEVFEEGVTLILSDTGSIYRVPVGVYRCNIRTNSSNDTDSVFVGIYRESGPELNIESLTVSVQSRDPLQFSVICKTSGGPVTNVTWTRNSEIIEGGVSDITNAHYNTRYTNYVNVTEEGEYGCRVSNNKPSADESTLNVTIPDPPSNFTVSQGAWDEVSLSWTASPQRVQYYIIQYQLESESPRSFRAYGTPYTLQNLVRGGAYSFSITSFHLLYSNEIGPVNITLVTLDDILSVESDHDAPFYAGTTLNISCVLRDLPETVFPQMMGRVSLTRHDTDRDYPDRATRYNSNSTLLTLDSDNYGNYTCNMCIEELYYVYYYYSSSRRTRTREVCETTNRGLIVSVEETPPPVLKLILAGVAEAGRATTMNCTVSVVPHLAVSLHPLVELVGPTGVVLASGETDSLLSYTMDPVMTWNAGLYYCRATIDLHSISAYYRSYWNRDIHSKGFVQSLSVQLPQPNVSITAEPPGHLFKYGSSATLTCEAALSQVVNRYSSVSLEWGGPRIQLGERSYTVLRSGGGLRYSSSLTMTQLSKIDEGGYTCTVRVSGEGNVFGGVVTQLFPLSVTYYGAQ